MKNNGIRMDDYVNEDLKMLIREDNDRLNRFMNYVNQIGILDRFNIYLANFYHIITASGK